MLSWPTIACENRTQCNETLIPLLNAGRIIKASARMNGAVDTFTLEKKCNFIQKDSRSDCSTVERLLFRRVNEQPSQPHHANVTIYRTSPPRRLLRETISTTAFDAKF